MVPCKHLFSASKQTAEERHAHLGSQKFEELQILKFAWWQKVPDLGAWNSAQVEEINSECLQDLLDGDKMNAEFEKGEDEMVVDYY